MPLTTAPVPELVDLLVVDGRVSWVGDAGTLTASEIDRLSAGQRHSPVRQIDGEGRWLLPGLWDSHVHLLQWARVGSKIDLSAADSAAEVCRMLAGMHGSEPSPSLIGDSSMDDPLMGFGYRSATWPDLATVAALDDVTGERPTVLISGDAHQGWLNSAALRVLELPPREDPLTEDDWFAVAARAEQLSTPRHRSPAEADQRVLKAALRAAADKGIVGMVDLEFGDGWRQWPHRFAAGLNDLRIRVGCYADELGHVLAAGLETGDPLDGSGRLTMGPFKIISDGSLNTLTAWCCQPYVDDGSAGVDREAMLGADRGQPNQTSEELRELLMRARIGGLSVAVHAIGDRAAADALAAIGATGARGTLEHAQLLLPDQIPVMAQLGVTASIQPAHLLDDRDVADRVWSDRTDRCFMFGSLARAGVPLRLGSDAPVAPLDPWLAMAAAVHRTADARPAWNPSESLSVQQALAASTDGVNEVVVGGVGDVILVDRDPLTTGDAAQTAALLRTMPVALTVVDGRPVAGSLAG